MIYARVSTGTFITRLNRFSAQAKLCGQPVLCHVKNTGRLKELLMPGAAVGLAFSDSPGRKTAWDLISVLHDGVWVNIDSQAPNGLYAEWAVRKGLPPFRREVSCGGSRFDFLFGEDAYTEVKGVTLVKDGTALFPDAPTLRGEKHLAHLAELSREGKKASVVFVVTHPGALRAAVHPERPGFIRAMREAADAGVRAEAFLCSAAVDRAEIVREIPFILP